MKILKKILIAIVALVVIIIIAAFIGSQFISKSLIENQLSQATGRKLTIQGDLKPVISLSPSIRAESVSFANASWGSRPELAKVGKFDIQMQLIPLLTGKIIVKKFELDSADILLEKKGDVWNFSLEDAKAAKEQKEKQDAQQPKTKSMQFDVSSMSITNSILTIKQGGAPTVITVKSLKFAPHDDKMRLEFDGNANGKALKLSVDTPPIIQLVGAKKFVLGNINFESGNIKLAGEGTIDTGGAKPHIKGNFKTDTLDLNQAKPATKADGTKAPEPTPATGGGNSFSNEPLPFDAFDALNADVKITIGTLKSGNLVVQNISAPLKINNGLLTISPLTAEFAGGKINSSISASKSGAGVKLKGDNLLMEKILSGVANVNDFSNGPTTADIDLSGSGNTVAKLVNSLNGHSNIYMKQGEYKGRIPTGSVAELSKLLTGGGTLNTTPINCLLTNINWSNGNGEVQSMAVDSQYAYILGEGSIKLSSEKLDLVLTPTAKTTGLMTFAIPVAVKGSFSNPSFFPDPKGTLHTITNNLTLGYIGGKNSGNSFIGNTLESMIGDKEASTSPCADPSKGAVAAQATNGNTTLKDKLNLGNILNNKDQGQPNDGSGNTKPNAVDKLNSKLNKKLGKIF